MVGVMFGVDMLFENSGDLEFLFFFYFYFVFWILDDCINLRYLVGM